MLCFNSSKLGAAVNNKNKNIQVTEPPLQSTVYYYHYLCTYSIVCSRSISYTTYVCMYVYSIWFGVYVHMKAVCVCV